MPVQNLFGDLSIEATQLLIKNLLDSMDTKLNVNEDNRLRVSTMPGLYNTLQKDITANAQIFAVDVSRASNVMISCTAVTTVVGHNISFEGSLDSTDGTDGTWFSVQGARSNANIVATSTGILTGNPLYAYELSVNACKYFRLKTTAHTSGTMRWFVQLGSYATEPIPVNQVTSMTVSGTVTANSSNKSAGSWWTETITNLATGAMFTGTARANGTASLQYFNTMRVRVFSSHTGTLTIESSRDATVTNYKSLPEHTNIAITANTVTLIDAKVLGFYSRIRFTNTGVATTTALEILSSQLE